MNNLNNQELASVKGGASGVNSAFLNALMRTISGMFSIGQAVGSAIRRSLYGNYC